MIFGFFHSKGALVARQGGMLFLREPTTSYTRVEGYGQTGGRRMKHGGLDGTPCAGPHGIRPAPASDAGTSETPAASRSMATRMSGRRRLASMDVVPCFENGRES